MKNIFLLTLSLLLCSCGESEDTVIKQSNCSIKFVTGYIYTVGLGYESTISSKRICVINISEFDKK